MKLFFSYFSWFLNSALNKLISVYEFFKHLTHNNLSFFVYFLLYLSLKFRFYEILFVLWNISYLSKFFLWRSFNFLQKLLSWILLLVNQNYFQEQIFMVKVFKFKVSS